MADPKYIFLIPLLAILAVLAVGCDAAENVGGYDSGGQSESPNDGDPEGGSPDDEDVATRSFRLGVAGLVPRNWPEPSDDDWGDLFAKIPEYGELWGVHTGWNEGELDEDGVPIVVEVTYQASSGVTPYVALGVDPDDLTQEEADTYFAEHGEAFTSVCVEIARRHLPEIFLIGVEANRFFEKSAEGFEHFLNVYAQTYDAIKEASPATAVGSNFLLEYMRGAGARSGSDHQEHWDLLDRLGTRADLVSFTVYPFLDYDHPDDIPSTYLDVVEEHTDLPIMITETGWPSEPVSGISGSEAAQAAYLDALVGMVEELPLRALIWAFPHDPEDGSAGGLFDHISLRRNDGTAKQALAGWTKLRDRTLE